MQRLLATPAVRRLARLRQLADLSLSLPAATHTRLVHSLGVMHLAGAIFDRLLQRALVQGSYWSAMRLPQLQPDMRVSVQLAGLLHDVGHGPFSHVFETIVRRRASGAFVPHEVRTTRLILDTREEGSGIGFQLQASRPSTFASPEEVASMVRGLPPRLDQPEFHFLGQIVASELDADRMDFLVRDALHTGVRTGSADPWPIIDSLTLARDPDGTVRLALPGRAESAALDFLQARARAYAALYRSSESLAAHELLLLAFDERFPGEVDRDELEVMAQETDEGLLTRLEGRPGGHDELVRDVVRRLMSDGPYLVLPLKLGEALTPLSESALRVLARWRRPVDAEDVSARRAAISRVSAACFGARGEQGPWRTFLVLEEARESAEETHPTPWILDRPDQPARPLDWSAPARTPAPIRVSVAIPPEALVPPLVEAAIRSSPSWEEAQRTAREAVTAARVAMLYERWMSELDPEAVLPQGSAAIEAMVTEWLAARNWAAI